MRQPKVFCIGFHKTGTSSLAHALYVLGYRLTGAPLDFFDYDSIRELPPEQARARVWDHMPTVVKQNDAFQDTPWFMFYRELDERFPGSKFILTTRPTESWVKSVVAHFGDAVIPDHRWIYGVEHARGSEDVYTRVYDQHYRDVRAYFAERPDSLLEMNITAGDGWEKLCPFLGYDLPHVDFPQQNVAVKKKRGLVERTARRLRNKTKRLLGRDDDALAAFRVWRACYHTLEGMDATLRTLRDGVRSAETFHAPIENLCGEILEEVTRVKRVVGLQTAAPRSFSVVSRDDARRKFGFVALDLRHLAGAVVEDNVRQPVLESGRTVGSAILGICGRIDQVSGQLRAVRIQQGALSIA